MADNVSMKDNHVTILALNFTLFSLYLSVNKLVNIFIMIIKYIVIYAINEIYETQRQ